MMYNKDIKRKKGKGKMRIDRRINYKLVLDTETCPVDKTIEEVLPSNMWTYDIGWAVVDKKGNVYRTRSYVVAEIFLDEKEGFFHSFALFLRPRRRDFRLSS